MNVYVAVTSAPEVLYPFRVMSNVLISLVSFLEKVSDTVLVVVLMVTLPLAEMNALLPEAVIPVTFKEEYLKE